MDVKSMIKKRGMTQAEFAQKTGRNRVTMNQTINGNPTIKTLRAFARDLDCTVVDFFRDEDPSFVALISKGGVNLRADTPEELVSALSQLGYKCTIEKA